jgi:hypothetical protein
MLYVLRESMDVNIFRKIIPMLVNQGNSWPFEYVLGYLLIDFILQEVLIEIFPHLIFPTVLFFNSWVILIASIFLIILVPNSTIRTFLKKLDLNDATKVRE